MKLIYLIIGLFILTSCGNKQQTKKTEENMVNSTSLKEVSKELIHPKLRKGIKELFDSTYLSKFPDITIEESCFILYSLVNPEEESIVHFSDSVIILSYNNCISTPESYRGTIRVDGYNVAIMDHFNFLENYYNIDSLHQIPFDSFKSYQSNYTLERIFYIQDGTLEVRFLRH